MTADEALAKSNELRAWKALSDSAAYQQIERRIREAFDEARAGLADRNKEPAKRGEYVEMYHLTEELLGIPKANIAALSHELDRYRATHHEIPMGMET